MTKRTFEKRTALRVTIKTVCVSNDPWKWMAEATTEIGSQKITRRAFSEVGRGAAAATAIRELYLTSEVAGE